MKTFLLPDLGEGLPDAEVHEWHVAEGDEVKIDDLLVSMETAKAVVEVPSPHSGRIVKIYGKPGDIIETGNPLADFEVAEQDQTEDKATVVGAIEVGSVVIEEEAGGVAVAAPSKTDQKIKAIPAVRAMAKKLGVDLATLTATGANGSISLDDVKNAAPSTSNKTEGLLHGARRSMAIAMAQIHQSVVPVTLIDDADIHLWPKGEDISIRIVRAIQAAILEVPILNSHFDGKALTMKTLEEINLGLAVDTPKGLFVPVLKNIKNHDDKALRSQINDFKSKAKANEFTPEDLHDATITLSNFGVSAGRYANPIVVPPSVAIIGIGGLKDEVVAVNGEAKIHKIMPISITFDHRALTGGEVARFLAAFIHSVES